MKIREGGDIVSKTNVELLKDKITEYLKQGYSMAQTEKLLGLTKNDIQRYYEQVTGINPRDLIKEAKKKQLMEKVKSSTTEIVERKQTDKQVTNESSLMDKIKELENRITALESKIDKSLDINAIKNFSHERVTLTFRIPKDLRDLIKQEANNLNISINDFVIVLLANYFYNS